MIDVQVEDVLSFAEAARAVNPKRPVHVATLYRWQERGVKGNCLETVRIGGRAYTSRQALARFIAAINAPGAVPEVPNAAAIAAGRKLADMGV